MKKSNHTINKEHLLVCILSYFQPYKFCPNQSETNLTLLPTLTSDSKGNKFPYLIKKDILMFLNTWEPILWKTDLFLNAQQYWISKKIQQNIGKNWEWSLLRVDIWDAHFHENASNSTSTKILPLQTLHFAVHICKNN